MKLAIVTACPGGKIASVLSARLLDAAARRRGWETCVEIHDPAAPERGLTAADIASADWVLVVNSAPLDLTRFIGKRLHQSTPSKALQDVGVFLDRACEAATVHRASTQGEEERTTHAPRLVAVTACPTGVAHTFMAAEALQRAAATLGYELHVETRGSVGARNPLGEQAIAEADVVLLAVDIEVPTERFAGKRVYRCGTGVALRQAEAVLDQALAQGRVETGLTARRLPSVTRSIVGVYKHLLTGVSYMLPMGVAGGLLIALSFVFGIEAYKQQGTLASALMQIGGEAAFTLMVPLLAGYIAYSIADRPGLAPGMIGGLLASTLGAGFIGGIVAGFVAGYSAWAVNRLVRLPVAIEALKPILIIPLLATLVTGLVMIEVAGKPVADMLAGLTRFLDGMSTTDAALLGALLGAMMCLDLGGPINKAAYAFSVGLLASQSYSPMAATMAAGMVPPIGMGIACLVARRKFSRSEREAGRASLLLGLCFISEGGIPFAARDPLRVIPASMAGGALSGGLSMLFGCKLVAPHGGLFVLLIPNAMNHALTYLLAIAAGSLLTGLLYALLKRPEAADLDVTPLA